MDLAIGQKRAKTVGSLVQARGGPAQKHTSEWASDYVAAYQEKVKKLLGPAQHVGITYDASRLGGRPSEDVMVLAVTDSATSLAAWLPPQVADIDHMSSPPT